MKNRSQQHYNLAPVLYILNIELVKTNYRDIILNKAVKLSGIFRGKIDASMRTTCKISITTKVRLPVCIMKANSSIEWHPVRYRLFIRIGSICCHFTSQHRLLFEFSVNIPGGVFLSGSPGSPDTISD